MCMDHRQQIAAACMHVLKAGLGEVCNAKKLRLNVTTVGYDRRTDAASVWLMISQGM